MLADVRFVEATPQTREDRPACSAVSFATISALGSAARSNSRHLDSMRAFRTSGSSIGSSAVSENTYELVSNYDSNNQSVL